MHRNQPLLSLQSRHSVIPWWISATMTISPPSSRLITLLTAGTSPTTSLPAAETRGFTAYPPTYLSPEASGKNLLIRANFASAGSGYDDKDAMMNYFKEYQAKLAKVAGSSKSASIIKDALYVLSAGSGDFLQNYYVNPLLNHAYSGPVRLIPHRCLHKLRQARKIGVTSLPPLGCVPLARTLFGYHEKGCISRFNTDAQQFNKKLNSAAANLQKQHSDLRIVVLDIFKALFHIGSLKQQKGVQAKNSDFWNMEIGINMSWSFRCLLNMRSQASTVHSLGAITIKDFWLQIRNREEKISWHKLIWFPFYIPKFNIITWMALLNRLPTKDRLIRMGFEIDDKCVLCNDSLESRDLGITYFFIVLCLVHYGMRF
ncbi:GDSL esterase/lipase APG [Hibiscus syriacus]|uniref:GDSL esterase/lipase APG n=1 Tax=Hibiscus syriacus TaxID=106335 RepID=A0A6A3AAE6_HIBSY|nr:GDSL esterase/lipase APG [Hibiscus syriacus]